MERTMSNTDTGYRTVQVPVRGGMLAVGVWGQDTAPTVLAIHGITATHKAWQTFAEAMPHLRIIAPDLRGRGRSNELPGPWGMPSHADDLKAVLDAMGVRRTVVIGHSMGAFVASTLAQRYASAVSEVILVDGGLPIPAPVGVSPEDLPKALIGPAAERLSMTFESPEAYRAFWRNHPALSPDWSPAIEAYIDYDLRGTAPEMSPSASYQAVLEDSLQLSGDVGYADALAASPVRISFLRAPRGLLNEPQALYSTSTVEEWEARVPSLTAYEIADVNHYTIVMSRRGADQLGAYVTDALARATQDADTRAN
jgi:pimeloyl-ACP methyl ester carboxylesterase